MAKFGAENANETYFLTSIEYPLCNQAETLDSCANVTWFQENFANLSAYLNCQESFMFDQSFQMEMGNVTSNINGTVCSAENTNLQTPSSNFTFVKECSIDGHPEVVKCR
jgi:hypothetical protein